ncbi:MAG: hypothetical protein IPK67_18660 [Planctomycetes bacterium]|nr:hypothetical protein [Planctomycetota bacterium]
MYRELARVKGACPEVRAFLGEHESLAAAWGACPKGSWLLGLLARLDRWWSPRLQDAAAAAWALAFPAEAFPAEGEGRTGCSVGVSQLAQLVVAELGGGPAAELQLADAIRSVVPAPEDAQRRPIPSRGPIAERWAARLEARRALE